METGSFDAERNGFTAAALANGPGSEVGSSCDKMFSFDVLELFIWEHHSHLGIPSTRYVCLTCGTFHSDEESECGRAVAEQWHHDKTP